MEILYHALIYTLDPQRPTASALAIDRGRILAVGSDYEILSRFSGSPQSQLTYLGGRVVIPGLTDAHIHLEHYALSLQKVDCETPTRQECLERVAERARHIPPGAWILGHGWNHNSWIEPGETEGRFGSAAELEAVAPNNPVYLTAKSLHAGWANSAALRLANLNSASPDPEGGRLGRDSHGNPDGILFESAMELMTPIIPEPSAEEVAQAIQAAQAGLWRMGLTGVHDFDRRRCFMALQALHQSGKLRLRVVKSLPWDDLPQAAALGLHTGFGDDFLRIGSVKAFADGALGPNTAAMLQPYEGSAGNRGMLLLDAEDLYEGGRLAVDSGLSLAVHAIGDRANHEVLDAFAHLREYEQQTRKPGRTNE
ncbi:MAG TPA: amidohydrolase family protein, partial [Anaerolineales bacterium]